jgi:geranylgeranyl diphosphate synthase type I
MINEFSIYSEAIVPSIDGIISDYYAEKIRTAPYPFMSEMYGDLSSYCLRSGKRVRPMLLLVSYDGYRKGKNDMGELVKLAASLEMMHSFLLIQDDIIDRSETRRGDKALHIITSERYCGRTYNANVGTDVAMIMGDVLFSNALELVSNADICNRARNRFLSIFAGTYEMTAWGQILDSLNTCTRNIMVQENIPLQISTLKTAYYTMFYPLLMGHVLAGPGDEQEKEAIRNFALPLGLAFQLRDDILGVFGDEATTGKSADSDIMEGKLTLLIQNTLERLKGPAQKDFITRFTAVKKKKADIKAIRGTIESSGALEFTREKKLTLLMDSMEALERLSISKAARKRLAGLVEILRAD